MRLKFSGEITIERLAEGLARAKEIVGENFGGFFGANLYLNVFNKDGESINLINENEQEIMLTFKVPDGQIAKPALSESAKERKKEGERAKQEKDERIESLRREQQEAWLQKHKEEMRLREENLNYVENLNELTKLLLGADQGIYLQEMNSIIQKVWEEMKPVYPNGKDKDKLRPMPNLAVIDGILVLNRDPSGLSRMKVKNPIAKVQYGECESHWKYGAWVEVSKRMFEATVMMAKKFETTQINEKNSPDRAS